MQWDTKQRGCEMSWLYFNGAHAVELKEVSEIYGNKVATQHRRLSFVVSISEMDLEKEVEAIKEAREFSIELDDGTMFDVVALAVRLELGDIDAGTVADIVKRNAVINLLVDHG